MTTLVGAPLGPQGPQPFNTAEYDVGSDFVASEGSPLDTVVIQSPYSHLRIPDRSSSGPLPRSKLFDDHRRPSTSSLVETPKCANRASVVRPNLIKVCVRLRPFLASDFESPRSSFTSNDSDSVSLPQREPSSQETSSLGSGKENSRPSNLPKAPSSGSSADSQRTDALDYRPAWRTDPNDLKVIRQSSSALPEPDKAASYTFDRVYGPSDPTATLYNQSIKSIIRSVVDGYHGSVFAYGQTNSGKTHTMTGTPEEDGVIRLAVKDIFRQISDDIKRSSRDYLLRVSYVEIYNEQIYDLLTPPTSEESMRRSTRLSISSQQSIPSTPTPVKMYDSRTEGVTMRGVREEIVTCPEDVFALLDEGDSRRKVSATGMNRASSRSHSVFRLVLESQASIKGEDLTPFLSLLTHSATTHDDCDSVTSNQSSPSRSLGVPARGTTRISSLSLVDLAGSESVKTTGATGVRQKEGQYINKSLLTLSNVVHKLSEMSTRANSGVFTNKEHIPYRDSKLTRLLKPSLGGNAKACIICNISPALNSVEESHNTLKFATRAKRIQQHVRVNEITDEKSMLRSYRDEIDELKRQLNEARAALANQAATINKLVESHPTSASAETSSIESDKPTMLGEQNVNPVEESGAPIKTFRDVGTMTIPWDGDECTKTPFEKIGFVNAIVNSLKSLCCIGARKTKFDRDCNWKAVPV